ncbi:BON domain-containing protein [Paraburkholderia sacchari]|uniref:BON domain-containing protein n=1 Tax=Paraburkholderia sacchari TaxID=159450 RepID=UPI000542B63E|nr:BON domain-containing protein [Paraburkholderia sacchari]NLP60684.1 BON domain-containing protein [Paraburkholderia sacchari]
MKMIRIGLAWGMVAGVAVSFNAYAQDGASAPGVSTSGVATASAASAPPSKAADRALRRRILNALDKTKGLQTSGITVRVHDGAVILQGWVPEQAQIDKATQVVSTVQGVTSVKNTLTLSTF